MPGFIRNSLVNRKAHWAYLEVTVIIPLLLLWKISSVRGQIIDSVFTLPPQSTDMQAFTTYFLIND